VSTTAAKAAWQRAFHAALLLEVVVGQQAGASEPHQAEAGPGDGLQLRRHSLSHREPAGAARTPPLVLRGGGVWVAAQNGRAGKRLGSG